MLDNILNWARLNLGQIRCVKANVDVYSIVSNELELLEHQIQGKYLQVIIYEQIEKCCHIDENLLRIIFRNIITNAIKYSPTDSRIEVEISKLQNYLVLSIKDYGNGIDAETIESIKTRSIVQSKSGTANERGNGLGLAIVSELAELHGGEILIDSELDQFTKVTAKLNIEEEFDV